MKKLMYCFLFGMCVVAAQAQNTPNTITLFGYTLECNSQVVGKKGELGRPSDAIKTECLLPNSSHITSKLKVIMNSYGVTSKPTVEWMENMINKLAYKEDEKYTFSCPGSNKVIGGYIHTNSSFPSESITLDTPTFTVLIEHSLTSKEPMFSSKKYLNQLCQWEPW